MAVAEPVFMNQARQVYVDPHADESERTYATFLHLVGLLSLLDAMVLGLVGSIVMWRIKAKVSPFLDDHGREAVNFQLSLLLYTFVGSAFFAIFTLGLGVLPWIAAIYIVRLIGCIRGAMASHRGEYYRYPVCIRFISAPTA